MGAIDSIRSTWAEIDLNCLAHNIREIKENVSKDTLIMAVVKANAYGHGAVDVSKTFLENGADKLAVAIVAEAVELRLAGIEAPILVLGTTDENQYSQLLKHNITSTIYNYNSAKALSDEAMESKTVAKIHIKIDTGMCRIGFFPNDKAVSEIIKISKLPNIEIEGIFTHFAKADEADKNFTRLQYNRFIDLINKLEKSGVHIPLKHASNSAAIIDLPEYNLNMVRPGIILYGLYPSEEVNKDKIKLQPAMTLKTKISNIKKVSKDTGISYGHIYHTEGKTKIATIPIGYADGFTRLLTSRGEAFINGKIVPVVGKICMDQCMLDVTEAGNVNIGDEVILFGNGELGLHIDDIANKLNTINYEIVCMVGRRVPRVYIKDEEIISIKDYLLD